MADTEPKVLVPVSKLLVCLVDHGGHKEVKCILCGKSGWETRFEHKPDCLAHPTNLPSQV